MKKSFLCLLILCLSICLTACGSGSTDSENAGFVYVPERISIPDSTADYGRMQLCGDAVCYITANQMGSSEDKYICKYSLGRQEAKVLFPWSDGEINGYYACGLSGMQDGGIFCAVEDYTSDDRNVVLLTKCEAKDVPNRAPLVLTICAVRGCWQTYLPT